MAKVKRKDNTAKFMKSLKKATQETLTEAAVKLRTISQQAVSQPYTGKRRKNRYATSQKNSDSKGTE